MYLNRKIHVIFVRDCVHSSIDKTRIGQHCVVIHFNGFELYLLYNNDKEKNDPTSIIIILFEVSDCEITNFDDGASAKCCRKIYNLNNPEILEIKLQSGIKKKNRPHLIWFYNRVNDYTHVVLECYIECLNIYR